MSSGKAVGPATTLIVAHAAGWTAVDELMSSIPQPASGVVLRESESLRDTLLSAPGDVVVVDRPCRLGRGWFEALDAVLGDDPSLLIATCVAFSIDESDGRRIDNEAAGLDLDAAAIGPPSVSRPSAPGAGAAVVLFRRAALDLLHSVNSAERVSLAALMDAASSAGLVTTLAEHVVARLLPGADPYPGELDAASVWRASAASRARNGRLGVTLDCRALTDSRSGTQVATLETLRSLARRDDIRLRVLVPPDLSDEGYEIAVRFGIEMQRADQLRLDTRCDDVVHRPHQLYTADDLAVLRPLGRRLIVTQLDLIGYRNAAYSESPAQWQAHRTAASVGLALADRVLVPSPWVKHDLEAERLVAPDRIRVVALGVGEGETAPQRPSALPIDIGPYILVLGADYVHKNRLFALQLFSRLMTTHSWNGSIVFAGPRVPHGGTSAAESAFLRERPASRNRIVDVGGVSPAAKAWLLREASIVLVPSAAEGFGFVPFEAALAGTAAAWAPTSSMRDVLPTDLATIVPWDEQASASAVAELLRDRGRAQEVVRGVLHAAQSYTWDRHAEGLIETYFSSIDGRSPRDVHLVDRADQALRVAEKSATAEFKAREDGQALRRRVQTVLPLVDGPSPLGPQAQVMMVALASRQSTRSVFNAAGVLYEKLRRSRRALRTRKGRG